MENRDEKLKAFLEENKDLFWHFDKTKLHLLSDDIIVEYLLNYGNEKNIKQLFELMGIDHVGEVFYRNAAPGRRINYFPATLNFFNLYFQKHASRNFKQRPIGTASFGQSLQS